MVKFRKFVIFCILFLLIIITLASAITTRYIGNVAEVSGGEVSYKVNDRLGSQRVIVDEGGEIVAEFKSLPYGQIVEDSGSKYGFTGKEKDVSTGLHYFSARYYDSSTGRFASVDPVKDNHAYSYVSNNPMNYVDPTGMYEKDLENVVKTYIDNKLVYVANREDKKNVEWDKVNTYDKLFSFFRYDKEKDDFKETSRALNLQKGIGNKYPNLESNSVTFDNYEEIEEYMLFLNEVSQIHFDKALTKYKGYPSLYCGHSSNNIAISMMDKGFTNIFYASGGGHAYIVTPFILENERIKTKGVIILDPTYGQFNGNKDDNLQNMVMVKYGENWKYYGDDNWNWDMAPTLLKGINHLQLMSKDAGDLQYDVKKSYKKAYANPIDYDDLSKKINNFRGSN